MSKFLKKRILASQRGDAMIMLSLVLTGLVMLVSVIAVDKLKQSSKIQNTQLSSLENTYKAEEGIEYTLFTAKEGAPIGEIQNDPQNPLGGPFRVSGWYNPDGSNTGQTIQRDNPLQDIASRDPEEQLVIISQNKQNPSSTTSQNKKLDKTIFANLPSKFPGQNLLWWPRMDCLKSNSCFGSSSLPNDKEYVVLFPSDNLKNYRKFKFVFKCEGGKTCKIKNIKVGYYTGEDCLNNVKNKLANFNDIGKVKILAPSPVNDGTGKKYWVDFPVYNYSGNTTSIMWDLSNNSNVDLSSAKGLMVYFQEDPSSQFGDFRKTKVVNSDRGSGVPTCGQNVSYYWPDGSLTEQGITNSRIGIVKVWGIKGSSGN